MKTILITGATAGIGEATARRFAREGHCRLILTGRRADRLAQLAAELSAETVAVLPLTLDVRDREAVEQAIATLPADFQTVDILVNNAGLALSTDPIQTASPEDWDVMLDTNVKGLLNISHAIMPGMIDRCSGHIINLGSIAGKEVYPGGQIYCASKFAVNAITQSMRIDLLRYGIRVSHVAPGMVETEFSVVRFGGDAERAKTPYQGITPLTGNDIAEVIWWISAQPPHVNINDIVVMPTAQANTSQVWRG